MCKSEINRAFYADDITYFPKDVDITFMGYKYALEKSTFLYNGGYIHTKPNEKTIAIDKTSLLIGIPEMSKPKRFSSSPNG